MIEGLTFRAMGPEDVDRVPVDCQGGRDQLLRRLQDTGSAAILAFEGAQHVGQLQFRRHHPSLRSASGIWSPDYWGDLGDDQPELPSQTLCLFCYHVGQLADGDARDASYFGRGIGRGLLEEAIRWARSNDFDAIVAKSAPSYRPAMEFMGGQPGEFYEAQGFRQAASWTDLQLHAALVEAGRARPETPTEAVAQVGIWVLDLKSAPDGRPATRMSRPVTGRRDTRPT